MYHIPAPGRIEDLASLEITINEARKNNPAFFPSLEGK